MLKFISSCTSPASLHLGGFVTINSSNPFDPPVINPNYLTTEFDIFTLREGVRTFRKFISAPAWSDYVVVRVSNDTTEAELDTFVRNGAAKIFHAVETAGTSPKGTEYVVVDPDLKAKGIIGLRIVGASILPIVPAAHIQAATYAIAERAAGLTKASW